MGTALTVFAPMLLVAIVAPAADVLAGPPGVPDAQIRPRLREARDGRVRGHNASQCGAELGKKAAALGFELTPQRRGKRRTERTRLRQGVPHRAFGKGGFCTERGLRRSNRCPRTPIETKSSSGGSGGYRTGCG